MSRSQSDSWYSQLQNDHITNCISAKNFKAHFYEAMIWKLSFIQCVTDPVAAKTVCTQLYFFTFDRPGQYPSGVAPQGAPHYYKLNDTQQQSELPSQRAADSMSPPLPPPSMEWGSVVLILAAEATSPWPGPTCLVGGGSRGGGGVALYKWSFGHQRGLSGLFNQNSTTKTKVFYV